MTVERLVISFTIEEMQAIVEEKLEGVQTPVKGTWKIDFKTYGGCSATFVPSSESEVDPDIIPPDVTITLA